MTETAQKPTCAADDRDVEWSYQVGRTATRDGYVYAVVINVCGIHVRNGFEPETHCVAMGCAYPSTNHVRIKASGRIRPKGLMPLCNMHAADLLRHDTTATRHAV